MPLRTALHRVMLDADSGWPRGIAGQLLASAGGDPVRGLLDQFSTQTDEGELWETALVLERLGDPAAIRPLAQALSDANPHRRRAAARVIGWIPQAGCRAQGP